MSAMKVFPAADLFPMLPDDELQQLAEDIKAHGLRDPIVIATIDGEEMLVDGRNRLAACKMAKVEPTTRHLNGEDPTDFVYSQNITRRHLVKGERAMLTAMMYPEALHGGARKKGSSSETKHENFSAARLSQARTVLRYLPETAKAVLTGKPLDEAYKEALAEKDSNESEGAKIERLKARSPDLAELVEANKLPLADAIAADEERAAQEKAAEENKRETLIRVSESTYRGIIAFANEEFTRSLIERLEDKKFRTAFLSRVRVVEGDPADFTEGAKALAKVMQSLTKGG
jgi:hypothetical protein